VSATAWDDKISVADPECSPLLYAGRVAVINPALRVKVVRILPQEITLGFEGSFVGGGGKGRDVVDDDVYHEVPE
jgi:hypothetical protein